MLRCFSAVVRTGNLAEAALRLSRTQSAVSMTLKQLETHLGHRLFESDRKNQLNALGQQVFELAQQQLHQFDYTVSAIETAANAPTGLLRIASVPSVAGVVFPPAIKALGHRHQGLKIELRDTDTQGVIDSLIRGQADFGIASGQHSLNGIRQTPLFEDQFGLICSPDNPLATQSRSPTIKEVLSSGFVRNSLCHLIKSTEFQEALTEVNVTVHNTLSLIGMIRTRDWITVLPEKVAQILPGELVFRKISGLDDRRPVFVLLRERSHYIEYAEELSSIVCQFDWDS